MDENNKYFRAGVGTVIYNNERKVLLFERAIFPAGIWQFQQGGIDTGETFETTLWRELKEEVGLHKEDFTVVQEYERWTVHPYPQAHLDALEGKQANRIGQCHRWFFLKIKDDTTIDLTKAEDNEFSSWKWTTFNEAINAAAENKQPVYTELKNFFDTLID